MFDGYFNANRCSGIRTPWRARRCPKLGTLRSSGLRRRSRLEDGPVFFQVLQRWIRLGADVVISNAYPSDLSLTAVLQKGTAPLQYATARVSRIVIASCADGVGEHGLFPVIKSRYLPAVQFVRRLSVLKAYEFAQAVGRRLKRRSPSKRAETSNPIWLYRPLKRFENLPINIPGLRALDSWSDVLAAIEREQGPGKRLKVFVYPCAPLQSFTDKQQDR